MKVRVSRNARSRKGASLILVLTMGTVAGLMALAVMDSLIEAYRGISNRVNTQEVNGAAESAAQYSIAYVNNYASENGGDVHAILNVPISIPLEVANTYIQTPPVLKKLSEPETSPAWAEFKNSAVWDSNNPSTDYVQLSVVATNGVDKSGIKVILGPNGYGKGLPTGRNSFFSNAILSSNSTTLGPNVKVALPPTTETNPQKIAEYYSQVILKSNGTLDLNGNSVGGSIAGLDAVNNSGSDKPTIAGNVHTQSAPENMFTPEQNVLGDGKNDNQIPGVVNNDVKATDVVPAPTPQSNGTANVDTDSNIISPGGDSSLVYDLGSSLVLPSNTVMTLKPGNYIADSVSIGSGSQISVETGSSGQGVNIYVNGKSAGDSAVSIGPDGIKYSGTNSSITSLQIYYNGSKNISMDLNSTFKGLIFAPKSKIDINSVNSGNVEMVSSVVGKEVNVNGDITWTYDPKSTDASSGGGGTNPIPGYSDLKKPTFFNVLSWQELSKSQLP